MRKVAIIGVYQTKHVLRRTDVNLFGLVNEAARGALEDAGIEPRDVEAVVVGNAPETFEGINQPEAWLASAVFAQGKPLFRIHTGGTVGGSTGIGGFYLVASGAADIALAVTFEKLSEGEPQYSLSACYDPFWGRDFAAGAPALAALQATEYMARHPSVKEEHFDLVAFKNRNNAVDNPRAHLRQKLSLEDIRNSPYVVSPLRIHHCCPTSDGAAAIVFAEAGRAKNLCKRPAWIKGVSTTAEGAWYPGVDIVTVKALRQAAKKVYSTAGITDPWKDIDLVELYDAFASQELIWLEAMGFAEDGKAPHLIEEGITLRDGKLPVNVSGGVISSNPIGASGMIRQVEAAQQVMQKAGPIQIDGVKTALAHAWGGWVQFHALMLMSAEEG